MSRLLILFVLLSICVASAAARASDEAKSVEVTTSTSAKAAGVAERSPWRASPTTVIVREEKEFMSGDIHLAGTLVLPEDGTDLGAIVVYHGASSPLRTSPLYEHLVEMLPPLGIAVFVFDRRGSGASGGTREGASFEELADDGLAAVELLRKDERIDPDRIGAWGLSQGGWLAVLAARSPQVKFAVSIAAPLVTPDVQMMFSSTNMLRVFGYPQADIDQMRATRKAVDDYMRGHVDRDTAQRAVDAAKTKPWFRFLYMGETVKDRAVSGWRREIEHDPFDALAQVDKPLLVLHGAVDPVVPVATSVERLAQLAPTRPHMDVFVIANADHHMQIGVDPRILLDPDHDDEARPDAPEYFAILSSWLTAQGIAKLRGEADRK